MLAFLEMFESAPARRKQFLVRAAIFLLGALLVWNLIEPGVRYASIRRLVRVNRDKMGEAWSREDAHHLWKHLDWFRNWNPSALTERLVDSIRSEDPIERELGLLLAAHIEHYGEYGHHLSTSYAPWILPTPALPLFSSREFDLARAFFPHQSAFARLARDEGKHARHCFLKAVESFLTAVGRRSGPYTATQEAVTHMALNESDLDLRIEAIRSLSLLFEDRTGISSTLSALCEDPNPSIRLVAAGELACTKDPRGFGVFASTIADPVIKCDYLDKVISLSRIMNRIPVLEPLCRETIEALRGSADAMPTLAAKWKAAVDRKDYELPSPPPEENPEDP